MPEAESSPAEQSEVPPTGPLALAADFPAATLEQWLALADAAGGAEKLGHTTPDGIRVRPLYTAADLPDPAIGVPGSAPFVRGSVAAGAVPAGWDVRQRHAEPDVGTARAAIAADLENGVTSIWVEVSADGSGTAPADLPAVLADVLLDLAPVVLEAVGTDQLAVAEAFLSLAQARGVAPAELLGTLGLDPVGERARTGAGPAPDSVVPLARRIAAEFPRMRAVVVDALPVHVAGGSDAQELGFSLAAGVAYLRALTGAGLAPGPAARLLEFRYAATAEQFPTIAKLRAARRLWSRVTEACGAAVGQHQHAVGSPTMLTRRDPYVNLVRGTLAGFAAGIGGADAVTVPTFDAAIGVPDPFSRRLARNTQALLVEEAHLARVIDAAGGSWYVEAFTDALARAAWDFFQQVEAVGGVVAALDSGFVAEQVAAVRARREKGVATRRVPITGVSEFPDPAERPVARRRSPVRPGGGLPEYRPAAPFEALRDRSDAQLTATGARPRAFLATLGPLAAHAVRAGFARNLLQAGGIGTVDAGPTDSPQDVVTAFAAAGTPVAVLCSTDALYAERAADTVAALKQAGAGLVLLAGKADVPGLDGRFAAGSDALAVLDTVYAALEVGR